MTRKDFSASIVKSYDKIIEAVIIEAGDFSEGLITKEEILRCYEIMKNMNLPIYYSHQRTPEDMLGFVEKVWLDNEKIMGRIKLYEDTKVQRTVLGHIRRGNITHLSLGFRCGILPLFEGKEMLTDLSPEEVSIVGLYPEQGVCPACIITEKNFAEESLFTKLSDEELLIEHLKAGMEEDEGRHNLVIIEFKKRGFYHA